MCPVGQLLRAVGKHAVIIESPFCQSAVGHHCVELNGAIFTSGLQPYFLRSSCVIGSVGEIPLDKKSQTDHQIQ